MTRVKTSPAVSDFPRPLVSVDVIIFTVIGEALQVLLVRRPQVQTDPAPGQVALPGGFVDVQRDESLMACALRKLHEKSGVAAPYLEQLGSWGDATRDPRGWSTTHAFFALIPGSEMQTPGAEWHEVEAACRSTLAFDHGDILCAAVARLRSKVEYTSLPAFLLHEPFTLPQLQRTYEIVLGRSVDKSAFRKRMLDAGFLAEEGMVDSALGRPAMAYRLEDRSQVALFPRTFSPRGAAA